jgi:hypothetical protein
MAAAERVTSSGVVDQFENDTRIAGVPFHSVPPTQQVPSAWMAAIAAAVRSGSASLTSTWLSTTSLRMLIPGYSSSSSAIWRASAQQRSTNSATPRRPSVSRTA